MVWLRIPLPMGTNPNICIKIRITINKAYLECIEKKDMGARKSIVPFLHYKTENAVQSTQFDLSKLRDNSE